MASLNLSTNGTAIAKSYESIVNSRQPTGPSAASATYGQWAVYSVTAPLISAFQQDVGKESVLKVQSTGEGELIDMIDDFSDGRIQFAFVKVKDPKTSLPKYALIGWCGEGVPERTKGYFASHQAAVSKILHGYHIQISARSDRDLTPEGIIDKISNASGADYSRTNMAALSSSNPPPIASKKPIFTAAAGGAAKSSFNPLISRRSDTNHREGPVDEDGWGDDAPPVTRTQLEKVEPAYKPTKVDIRQLVDQSSEQPRSLPSRIGDKFAQENVIKGEYQPVGKVDIAAIRKQAVEDGRYQEDRPTPVKGAYEPIGKVDIAEIRARSLPHGESGQNMESAGTVDATNALDTIGNSNISSEGLKSSPATGRLAELPKPKIANRFGANSASNVAFGTKAPTPGQFGLQSAGPSVKSPPIGAGRTFADSAGKSPAQLWAEKKAAQGNASSSSSDAQPLAAKEALGWKSGYSGKKWAPVQPTKPVLSMPGGDDAQVEEPKVDISLRSPDLQIDRAPALPTSLPAPGISNKPAGVSDISATAAAFQPELSEYKKMSTPSPTIHEQIENRIPPEDSDVEAETGSPVLIAMPVARDHKDRLDSEIEANDEVLAPSTEHDRNERRDLDVTETEKSRLDYDHHTDAANETPKLHDQALTDEELPEKSGGRKKAVAQYDYEKAEDNELGLKEGEIVTNIEMVDPDWWMGQNSRGEIGLFPSNYVELLEDEAEADTSNTTLTASTVHVQAAKGQTAVAQYDYEAGEDNELSFPEGAKINNVEFPDDDWWHGEYNGSQGLFPAAYVELDKP